MSVINNGLVAMSPGVTDSAKDLQGPTLAPLGHSAINKDGQWNTLLLVCRKGWVEVYLNGVAVCNPQPIDAAFDPDRIQFCLRTADVGEAEFEHLKIYSAGGLPTPQQRLAAGNFGN